MVLGGYETISTGPCSEVQDHSVLTCADIQQCGRPSAAGKPDAKKKITMGVTNINVKTHFVTKVDETRHLILWP